MVEQAAGGVAGVVGDDVIREGLILVESAVGIQIMGGVIDSVEGYSPYVVI